VGTARPEIEQAPGCTNQQVLEETNFSANYRPPEYKYQAGCLVNSAPFQASYAKNAHVAQLQQGVVDFVPLRSKSTAPPYDGFAPSGAELMPRKSPLECEQQALWPPMQTLQSRRTKSVRKKTDKNVSIEQQVVAEVSHKNQKRMRERQVQWKPPKPGKTGKNTNLPYDLQWMQQFQGAATKDQFAEVIADGAESGVSNYTPKNSDSDCSLDPIEDCYQKMLNSHEGKYDEFGAPSSQSRYSLSVDKPATEFSGLNTELTENINKALNKEVDNAIEAEIERQFHRSQKKMNRGPCASNNEPKVTAYAHASSTQAKIGHNFRKENLHKQKWTTAFAGRDHAPHKDRAGLSIYHPGSSVI